MINYIVKKSKRAKRMRVTIHKDASVVVTIPARMSLLLAARFVQEKKKWIEDKVAHIKSKVEKREELKIPRGSKADLEKNKEKALALIEKKLAHFNTHYGFAWKNVSVKHLKTRWGSCSRIGNLNFSYKIIYLPEVLQDYLVVHELCHLGEFNHSKKFWALMARTVPDYAQLRKQLRGIE
jgi:predicted metal-dependent hydrolase